MTTKHTFSSALSVIVRELHIRNLSENHVIIFFFLNVHGTASR